MLHRGLERIFVTRVVAAIKMNQHSGTSLTLARDGQVRIDWIELQLVRDLGKEFSLQMTELRLDGPHQLDRFGNERTERPESFAQLRPSVGAVEQILEPGLRPRGKDHADSRVAAGIWERVERDIYAVVAMTLDFGERVLNRRPGAPADEDQMRDLQRHAGLARDVRHLAHRQDVVRNFAVIEK